MAKRVLQPRGPMPAPAVEATSSSPGFFVESFFVDGIRKADKKRLPALKQRFLEYLEVHGACQRLCDKTEDLRVRAQISLDKSTYWTGVIDVASYSLIAPWWGSVEGTMTLDATSPEGRVLKKYLITVKAPFSNVLGSWYNARFVEDAYQRVYAKMFLVAAQSLAADAVSLGQLAEDGESTLVAETQESSFVEESPTRPKIVWEPQGPRFSGTLGRVLHKLGGLEGSVFLGGARVVSHVKDDAGLKVPLASGRATAEGYQVSLYSAPTATGWFVSPSLGFLSQHLEIADFRATLPSGQVKGGTEIGARCSDPTSDKDLDCGAPNTYKLDLNSLYAGARAGYDFVGGTSDLWFFASLSVALNAFEYRDITARVSKYRAQSSRAAFFQSGALGYTLGLALPKIGLSSRVIADYEAYRRFRYAEPLEFKGLMKFNEAKQVYERPRTFVRGADVQTWRFQWALAYSF